MRVALREFSESIGRIEDIADFIDASVSAALADAKVLKRNDTIGCAAVVTLTGYFETFLRVTAQAYVRDLCASPIPFTDLPERVRRVHFEGGSKILGNVFKRRVQWSSANEYDVARRLSSVVAQPYELVWEAFADTRANPGPTVITEWAGDLGVTNAWGQLEGVIGRSALSLRTELESMITVRNECAHTGTSRVIPTPSTLRGYCTLLNDISVGLVTVLELTLRLIALPAPPPQAVLPSPPP